MGLERGDRPAMKGDISVVVKSFLTVFILSALLLSVVFWFIYHKDVQKQQMALKLKETSRLNTQKEVINSYLQAIAVDVLIVSKHYGLRMILDNSETHYLQPLAEEFLWFSKIKKIYDQVRFLDDQGMEILRVNFNDDAPSVVPREQLQPKASRYYFKDAFQLEEGEVFVSPFDLNIEHGALEIPIKPMIRFATPVFDSSGRKRGIVLLNYLGADLLKTLEATADHMTGKVILLNSDGYYLRSPNSDDEWGFMYESKKDKTFAKTHPEVWQKLSKAESGQFAEADGIYSFTTIRPISEAQVSSTGSGMPFLPSEKPVKGMQYYWKLVSYIPSGSLQYGDSHRLRSILFIYAAMLVLCAFGSGFVAYASSKRRQAEKGVRQHRDFLEHLVEQRTAELKSVNQQLQNDIDKRIQIEAQLRQAQKMESVGRLAGGVAHDYNNALSVIIGFTEMAIDDVDPQGPLRSKLDEILNAAGSATEITRQLLAFASKQEIVPKPLSLNHIVTNMLKMLRRLIGEDIELTWVPAQDLWTVKVDPSQVNQILANLCVNARDAIKGVGKITIETKNTCYNEACGENHAGFTPGEYVMLSVRDDGCGIEKEIIDKIFEPFFTTKTMDKGTGLGLATVYGIVKQNKGFIDVDSKSGAGTAINVYLPRHMGEIIEDQEIETKSPPKGNGETILLVEDDLSILNLTRQLLSGLGYIVMTASTPKAALKLSEQYPDRIHLLITDVIMPEMNGRDLVRRMETVFPDIKHMFMSGYTADVIVQSGVLDQNVHFMRKPFSIRELAATVRKALED